MRDQQEILRKAKKKLGVTTAQLAELLGVSEHTLNGWLLPEGSTRHREMPKTAALLLGRILAEHTAKKRARNFKSV